MPDSAIPQNAPPAAPRPRLWLWFAGGCVMVFVGVLFLSMESYDGYAVTRNSVWRYYLLEIQRALNSTGNLGPTSDNSAHAASIASQHLLASAIGGMVTVSIGWLVRKFTRKQ